MPPRVSDFDEQVLALYEDRKDQYRIALTRVNDTIAAIISDRAVHTLAEQRRVRVEAGRLKEPNRLLVKAQSQKYSASIKTPADVFVTITDIAGTRITCNTYEDVRRIESAILSAETFELSGLVQKEKAHEDYLAAPKESGYRAVHFLVDVAVPKGGSSVKVPVEIQIRTLLQHSWGELTHEDTFKPGAVVPPLVQALSKRLATALAVLDEIAQDLRDELNKIEKEPAPPGPSQTGASSAKKTLTQSQIVTRFEDIFGRTPILSRETVSRVEQAFRPLGDARLAKLEKLLDEARRYEIREFETSGKYLSDLDLLELVALSAKAREPLERTAEKLSESRIEESRQRAEFAERYIPGSGHFATAVRVTPRYVIAQLSDGTNAIVSARHEESGRLRVNLEDLVVPGATLRIEVVRADVGEKRLEARIGRNSDTAS